MKAKAVVFTDRLQVAVRQVDVPEPGADDVVIDVDHSWISIGTESSFLRGERVAGERPYREGDPWPFPNVAGYQKTGVVAAKGANVGHLTVGDRVFATMSRVNGMFFPFGGHISPAVTPVHQVWKLSEVLPSLDYCGMVLTQVGFNCGNRPTVRAGDLAVVIGDGLVGQWAAQTLLHRGAQVIVLGRHAARLAFLPSAIRSVNTREQSIREALGEERNVAVLVDSVGAMSTVRDIQPLMRRDSHLVSAGFLGETGIVNIQQLREQEITLHTPSGWTKERMDLTQAGIAAGWLMTSPLITHRYPVDRAEEAWRTLIDHKQQCLGVVLDWEQ